MAEKYFTGGQSERVKVSTRDPDELTALFVKRFGEVTVRPHQRAVLTGIDGTFVTMPGLKVDRSKIVGGFDFLPIQKLDSMIFCFPLSGNSSVETRDKTFYDRGKEAICFHGAAPIRIKQFDGREHCLAAIDTKLLLRRVSDILERPVKPFLQFADSSLARASNTRPLFHFVRTLVSARLGEILDVAPSIATPIPNQIADLALMAWPNNFSEVIAVPPSSVSPRQVKRAIEYIHSNSHNRIRSADVASAAGVSIRALQYSFERFVGMGIAEYQRKVRLEKAKVILKREPNLTIAEVAQSCGYSNAAHFTKAFTLTFGVTPSFWRNG